MMRRTIAAMHNAFTPRRAAPRRLPSPRLPHALAPPLLACRTMRRGERTGAHGAKRRVGSTESARERGCGGSRANDTRAACNAPCERS